MHSEPCSLPRPACCSNTCASQLNMQFHFLLTLHLQCQGASLCVSEAHMCGTQLPETAKEAGRTPQILDMRKRAPATPPGEGPRVTNSETRFASALAAWQRTRQAHKGAVAEAETRRVELEASAVNNLFYLFSLHGHRMHLPPRVSTECLGSA